MGLFLLIISMLILCFLSIVSILEKEDLKKIR